MSTGAVGWQGYPPQAIVTERMLLSQLPEEDRIPFMQAIGTRYELNRSGEPVFAKKAYTAWKQSK